MEVEEVDNDPALLAGFKRGVGGGEKYAAQPPALLASYAEQQTCTL